MDTTSLVIAIEDAFSIRFPDEKLETIETVGDLFDYILDESPVVKDSGVCLSAASFYALRRAVRSLGHEGRVHPKSKTVDVLPESEEQTFWDRLERTSKLNLPPLRMPTRLATASFLAELIAVGIIGVLAYYLTQSVPIAISAVVLSAVMVFVIADLLTRSWAIVPPATFRQLTEAVLAMNFQQLSERYDNTATRNDAWIALREIIADEFGLSPHRISPETNFVIDLGSD